MNKREFTRKLSKTSKNVLRPLIPALGMHLRNEKAIHLKYIEEKCLWDIAEELGVAYESAGNFLCQAREEMLCIMQDDYDILPKDIQVLIDKLLK